MSWPNNEYLISLAVSPERFGIPLQFNKNKSQMGNESSCISETSKHLLVPSNLLQVQRLEGPDIPNLHFWDNELSRIAFWTKVSYDFRLAEIEGFHQERGLPALNEKDFQWHCHEYARYALLEKYFSDIAWRE